MTRFTDSLRVTLFFAGLFISGFGDGTAAEFEQPPGQRSWHKVPNGFASNWRPSHKVPAEFTPPSNWWPWNEVHVYAPDLNWKSEPIPKAAFAALPKWITRRDADGDHSWSWPIAYTSVDLDGDGNDELIVRSGEPFSGGPQFAILQKYGNRWREIGEFQGGFAISKRVNKGLADIETWSRHPETYHFLRKFSGRRYKVVREKSGLWEDRALDPPFVP